jgi:hypothetical protein
MRHIQNARSPWFFEQIFLDIQDLSALALIFESINLAQPSRNFDIALNKSRVVNLTREVS